MALMYGKGGCIGLLPVFWYNIWILLNLNSMELPEKQTKIKTTSPGSTSYMPKHKILRGFVYVFFFVVLIFVLGQLFFQEEMDSFFDKVKDTIFGGTGGAEEQMEELRVIYPQEPVSLEPTLFDFFTRQRLVNIYEPLVKTDQDLKMKPALALSWGLFDEKTWEFNLRPDVKFHDGSALDVMDVKASLDRALNHENSEGSSEHTPQHLF